MPKLSIITINYNNAAGLKKTMDSVFEQNFTDYEYLIIDGESTDGSKQLIRNVQNQLAYWVSENDSGVYHAMNKGIVKAKGEYLLFLNSGDFLYSKSSLSSFFDNSGGEDIVYGDVLISKSEEYVKRHPAQLTFGFFLTDSLHHQSTIIKKNVFEKTGLYNEHYKFVSDWEVLMNAVCLYQASYKYINRCVSVFPADGISSQPQNLGLLQKERKAVVEKYYKLFLPDYEKAEECEKALKESSSSLKNISDSHSYQFLSGITHSFLYKFIKRTIGFKR